MERHEGAGRVIVVLMVVATLGAMAEVAASRAAAPTVTPPSAAAWEASARVADQMLAGGGARVSRRARVMASLGTAVDADARAQRQVPRERRDAPAVLPITVGPNR